MNQQLASFGVELGWSEHVTALPLFKECLQHRTIAARLQKYYLNPLASRPMKYCSQYQLEESFAFLKELLSK